jgi:hypothetical protein
MPRGIRSGYAEPMEDRRHYFIGEMRVERERAAILALAEIYEAEAVALHESQPAYAEHLLAKAKSRRDLAADRGYLKAITTSSIAG